MRMQITLKGFVFGVSLLSILLASASSWAADIEPLENRIKATMQGRKVNPDLEEEVRQRNLKKLLKTLQEARNVQVAGNAEFLPNPHEHEQKQYCGALLSDIKEKAGKGVTIPKPIMSTVTDGNLGIIERAIKISRSCNKTESDIMTVLGGLTFESYFPRLFDVYRLNGSAPKTIIFNKMFLDNDYQHFRSVHWYEFDRDGCFSGGEGRSYPKTDVPADKNQAGVLTFHEQTYFYSVIAVSETFPGTTGEDVLPPCKSGEEGFYSSLCEPENNRWLLSLFAPQMTLAEISSPEAASQSLPPRRTSERLDYTCRIYFE